MRIRARKRCGPARLGCVELLLVLFLSGSAYAQAPFLARPQNAVLFGGVYSHDTGTDGRDALGAGVGFTVASWTQVDASIARTGGEHQTNYGIGIEVYPLRLLREVPVEPFVGVGWSHTAIFPEQTDVEGLGGLPSVELDTYPITAGLSARLDLAPQVIAALQLALLQVAGDRGPARPGRSGWTLSLGLCAKLSSRRTLVLVPALSRVYDRNVGSLLFGLQFGRS